MAMHPDDPPMSPLCGLERIMDRVESFERLLAFSSSPANALTFCAGCFGELGVDVVALFEKFIDRVPYVHVRNIEGGPTDFMETFPDEGDMDMPAALRLYRDAGYKYMIMPDHVPAIEGDTGGRQAFAFCFGYIQALLQRLPNEA